MRAVVLAGGQGARLAPYTTILPKPLLPIDGMPILEVLLRQFKGAGINEVVLTVGYLAEFLRLFFQDGERLGLKICYSHEDRPLGTAGPLNLIEGLDNTFLVSNGDVLTNLSLESLIAFHYEQGSTATIAMHQREVKVDLGVIQLNGRCQIADYIEKPTYDLLVSMGIYVFEPRALNYIPHDQYFDFPDLVKRLLAAEEKVVGYPFDGYWQDLGRPDDYEQAAQDFESMRAEFLPSETHE